MSLEYFLKHGEKLQMWINKFKVALVEQNPEEIGRLLDNIPKFSSASELEEAKELITSSNELFRTLQKEVQHSMIQVKKNIDFLKATQAPLVSKLDINS